MKIDTASGLVEISQRVATFDRPFVTCVLNQHVGRFCNFCLRPPEEGKKLLLCGQCHFRHYCEKGCQRSGWSEHKVECGRLSKAFPNLPMTQALFTARCLDRLDFIAKNGDKHKWQSERNFFDLVSHRKDMEADQQKMEVIQKMYKKVATFMGDDAPTFDHYFEVASRMYINSHSVHNSVGVEIGMSLDMGVSRYDHSCRPNASMVFDGQSVLIRPLLAKLDGRDYTKTFISYIDVGRSKFERRRDLKAKWYFTCCCDRCKDPDDDQLTTMKCVNDKCKYPIVVTEDMEPKDILCFGCGANNTIDRVKQCQETMAKTPTNYDASELDEDLSDLKQRIAECKTILHESNIYYSRLLTAFVQVADKPGESDLVSAEIHEMIYRNYTRCFPAMDRHLGYQLLHLVKTLIEEDRRDDAIPYAYEAMQIFEICFGMDHPYYLQTLGLWTLLDVKAPKTKKELLSLLNFNTDKRINIAPLIGELGDLKKPMPKADHYFTDDPLGALVDDEEEKPSVDDIIG